MKRTSKVIAASILAAGLLSGSSIYAKTVTITWATARTPTKLNDTLVKMFEKQNPGIKVKMTNNVWDWQAKILTAVAGGVAPDVIQGWAEGWRSFIDSGLMLAVDPYLKNTGYPLNQYNASLLNSWRKGGKLYSLPVYCWTSAMPYNATLFAQSGVAVPTNKWTWDDYLDAARKLTIKGADGKVKQWGTVLRWSMGTDLPIWIRANGGTVTPPGQVVANAITVDQPKAVEAVQFVRDMIWKYEVAPKANQIVGFDYTMVATGKAAFWLGGSHDLMYYTQKNANFKFGIAEPPTGKAGKASIFPQDAYGVMKASKHPAEAMKFLLFLTSPEAVELRASSDEFLPPARRDAFNSWMKNHPLAKKGVDLSAYKESYEYAYPCPQFASALYVQQQLTTTLDRIFVKNNLAVRDGMSNLAKTLNTYLKKFKATTN